MDQVPLTGAAHTTSSMEKGSSTSFTQIGERKLFSRTIMYSQDILLGLV